MQFELFPIRVVEHIMCCVEVCSRKNIQSFVFNMMKLCLSLAWCACTPAHACTDICVYGCMHVCESSGSLFLHEEGRLERVNSGTGQIQKKPTYASEY